MILHFHLRVNIFLRYDTGWDLYDRAAVAVHNPEGAVVFTDVNVEGAFVGMRGCVPLGWPRSHGVQHNSSVGVIEEVGQFFEDTGELVRNSIIAVKLVVVYRRCDFSRIAFGFVESFGKQSTGLSWDGGCFSMQLFEVSVSSRLEFEGSFGMIGSLSIRFIRFGSFGGWRVGETLDWKAS